MSLNQLILIVFTVLMLSLGQILFKLAAMEMPPLALSSFAQFLKPKLLIAFGIYAVATVLWIIVLRITPLRQAYPFAALAFFIVPIFSWLWLGEALKVSTFIGAITPIPIKNRPLLGDVRCAAKYGPFAEV